jgi:glycosyltransferase involved in cell wall biosynthesis
MPVASDAAPRRPLLVSHTGEPGGSNVVLLALLDRLPASAVPACVFLTPGAVVDAVRARGVPVAVVEAGRAREAWRAPAVVRRLRGLVRTHRADVVFAHVAKAQLYAGPAARLAGVPSCWWQHEVPGSQPLQHRVAERLPAGAIVCSSDWTATGQRARTPRREVVRIHPGIELPVPDAAPPAGRPPRIGVVGRLQRWKRVELALAALPALLREFPGARLEIIGGADPRFDADYPAELEARARELGVRDAVELTGHVGDAGARIAALDVLVHTAREEPFGLVLVEALARGVPVVAPDGGGAAEIVRDGEDGLLVDVGDPGALAAALAALLRDPARRAAMAAAGPPRMAERFDVERMAAEAWALAARVAR